MSDAKRFEDWIIFDAHEFQYPDGDSMSEDSFAFQLELQKLQALQAKWDAIPWEAIRFCVRVTTGVAGLGDNANAAIDNARSWLDTNAPKPRPTTEQLEALVELIRKA